MKRKSALAKSGIKARKKNISKRVRNISVSAIKEMALLAMGEPTAISLSWGLPSFQTPIHIRETVKNALNNDLSVGKYSPTHGMQELRELIAKKYHEEKDVTVDPNKQIIVHAGAMEGLTCALQTVGDVGDEIILTDPGFASHIEQIMLFGMKPVFWKLNENENWSLDVSLLENLITDKTKAILLVNPANPTGTVYSEKHLRETAKIADKHDLMIICDDPYDFLVYENKEYFSIAQIKNIKDRVIYIGSLSKKYAMSGWRLGYSVSEAGIRNEMLKVHDSVVICAPTISQVAAISALKGPQSVIQEFHDELEQRRTLLYSRIRKLDKMFSVSETYGTYYVFPRILCKHKDSYEFALRILKETKVVIVPGGAFGPQGENHVRITFCGTKEEINEAFDRLERWQKNNCIDHLTEKIII